MKKFIALALTIVMLISIFAVEGLMATDATKCVLIQTGSVFGKLYCGDMVDVSKPGNYTVKVTGLNVGNTSDTGFFIGLKSGATSTNGSTASTLPEGTKITVTSAKINGDAIGLNGTPSLTVTDSTVDMVLKLAMWNTDVFTGTFPSTVNSIELGINVEMPASNRPAPAEAASAEIPVEISSANQGSTKDCTISGGVATSTKGANQFSFKLPKTFAEGETVKIKIRYTSDDQFRVRLSTNNANISGTDWVFVDAAASAAETELEFTALVDDVSEIYFKAKSYDSTLSNLKVSYIAIVNGEAEQAPVQEEVPAQEQVIVCFDDPDGNDVGVESPWSFFGVGNFWGNNEDLDIEFSAVKEIMRNGGATFSYVFSGTNPGTPKACFNFNLYGNPASEVNVPFAVTNLGNGKYEASVELDTLVAAWANVGKTLDDPDAAAFLIQPWASNFKIYSAKFTLPANTAVVTPTEPSTPETPAAADVPLDGFMKGVEITTFCPDNYIGKKSNVSYGEVINTTYYSTTCKMDRPVNIVLPANYSANKKYPVLYVLHGIFCDENTMMNSCGTHTIVQNMIADGSAREMIVVFPNMYASTDPNQEPAFDLESVKPYDNFVNDLVNDLMPYIASNYSIATGRDNTAIFGFSMGGRETLAIGFMHPELFGYVGAVAPAPGLTPGADWAMNHPGMFKESELVFGSVKPYMLMLCCGDSDGTVGSFPAKYHGILNTNGTQHIWYEIPGSDHADPAIASATYNFAKYAFKATAAPEPVATPSRIFYSPYTGSDTTGDGTQAHPFKTENKARAYAASFTGGANIEILEYMMAVEVHTGASYGVSAPTGTINMISFTGKVDSYYFKGETSGTGYDTQKYGVAGCPTFSARYFLTGTDCNGQKCSIFIENNGDSLDNCTPTVFTDSTALASWNTANLKAIVTVTGYGVLVEVYTIR